MMAAKILLGASLVLAMSAPATAQSVVDGSDSHVGPERTQAVLALIGKTLPGSDGRVSALRLGRAGALCGAIDVRNRMGTYTGPRGFVADLAQNFIGRLPEGPELRSPSSMAAFTAMERAKTLFAANCTAS